MREPYDSPLHRRQCVRRPRADGARIGGSGPDLPPFLALRSYLPDDHPDKDLEIGQEATPGEYIDALLDLVEACAEVLADHGSMCIELGDTYSESGGHGGDYAKGGLRDGQPKFAGSARQKRTVPQRRVLRPNGNITHHTPAQAIAYTGGEGWPLGKSLCLIPELFRVALVYGFNPLTGRQTPRWRARNVVRWCRPNPPVGALADKVRPATSDMVIICKGRSRYFDLEGVPNCCSMIYGALCRAAKALGYKRAVTYTLADEPGASLRASGFVIDAELSPSLGWNQPSRPRYEQDLFGNERTPEGPKIRWVRQL